MTLFVFCFLQHCSIYLSKVLIFVGLLLTCNTFVWVESARISRAGSQRVRPTVQLRSGELGCSGPWWLICSHCASRPRLPSLQFPGANGPTVGTVGCGWLEGGNVWGNGRERKKTCGKRKRTCHQVRSGCC